MNRQGKKVNYKKNHDAKTKNHQKRSAAAPGDPWGLSNIPLKLEYITQTCLCNICVIFKGRKNYSFRMKNSDIFLFLLKA